MSTWCHRSLLFTYPFHHASYKSNAHKVYAQSSIDVKVAIIKTLGAISPLDGYEWISCDYRSTNSTLTGSRVMH